MTPSEPIEAAEARYRQERQEREDRIYNRIVKTVFQSQLLLTLIVGLGFFVLSMVVAQTMIHAAMEELKDVIESNRCVCSLHEIKTESSGNHVTILPDQNSIGAMTRDVLRKRGEINGDVSGTPGTIGDGDR